VVVNAPASGALAGVQTRREHLALVRGLSWLARDQQKLQPALARVRGPAACARRDSLFRRALFAADVLGVIATSALIAVAYDSVQRASWLGALAAPTLVLGAKLTGLYDRDPALLRKSTLDETPQIAQLATLCTLVCTLATASLVEPAPGPGEVLAFWAALTAILLAARSCARTLALLIAPSERCLVIGGDHAAQRIRGKIEGGGTIKAELVAHVDLDRIAPWSSESFSESRLQEIGRLAQSLDVHRAIIAPRSADAGETLDLVRTLKAVGVRVSVLPRLLEVVGSAVEFEDVHGMTLMGISRVELTRFTRALKRGLDLVLSSLALLLLSPLLAAIATAIRLDSRGGALFKQARIGRHGRPFEIYKFRTMVADAEQQKEALRERNDAQDGLFKIFEDPRITRVGRALRRSALDELPQLINVLRGEMSLVGPRPLVPDEDSAVQGWQRSRLVLTPGITGPWQILGPARVPLAEMVAIDYLYIAGWSLWTDLKIMARTVPHVTARRGL
jgi:exopolysaccharide biosynthesis polyprenyl glycosylphosphotransferase